MTYLKAPFTLLVFLFFITFTLHGQATWEPLADHPTAGLGRMFSFEIDGLVYVGGGRNTQGENVANLWTYDLSTNTWTAKENFPGIPRRNAFSFTIGGMGYVGSGYDGSGYLTDFWRYDPANDSWTQLEDFPGGGLGFATGLATESKAYVVFGGDAATSNFSKKLWEYDPSRLSWKALQDFPGPSRWQAGGWIIGQYIYAGGGGKNGTNYKDYYRFDLEARTWSEIEECPSFRLFGGFYFTIDGKGYYVEGSNSTDNSLFDYGIATHCYDPEANSWTRETSYAGYFRIHGFSAVVDNKAIVGLGRNYLFGGEFFNDIYLFTPDVVSSSYQPETTQLQLFPNPISAGKLNITGGFENSRNVELTIFDMRGRIQSKTSSPINPGNNNRIQLEIENLLPGAYQIQVKFGDGRTKVLPFIKQ